jgi:hypothetical protein
MYKPKVETSLDRSLAPCKGSEADLANHAKGTRRSTEDQMGPIKEQKPQKESSTPSGTRGVHPMGALARTHRKTKCPTSQKEAHSQASSKASKQVPKGLT